jgi:hypothetical protein
VSLTAPARRVATFDDLTQAGDYFFDPGRIERDGVACDALCFLLPTHKGETMYDRPDIHSGLHMLDTGQGWTFTEHPDGSVSASPSIGCRNYKDGKLGPPGDFYWHGYLEPGNVWRWDG